jgi:hypothetical protein
MVGSKALMTSFSFTYQGVAGVQSFAPLAHSLLTLLGSRHGHVES